MITQAQAKRLMKLITAYAEAQVAYSWKGAQPPEDQSAIEQELQIAKLHLELFVRELQQPGV